MGTVSAVVGTDKENAIKSRGRPRKDAAVADSKMSSPVVEKNGMRTLCLLRGHVYKLQRYDN